MARLTDEQLWEFDCKGFINVEDLFETDLVEAMCEAAKPYRKEHYTQTNSLIEKHKVFYTGMFHPAIDIISRQFFGEYRIKGHVLVINPAQTGGKVGMKLPIWHQDEDHSVSVVSVHGPFTLPYNNPNEGPAASDLGL